MTQHDIDLVHAAEEHTGTKLTQCTGTRRLIGTPTDEPNNTMSDVTEASVLNLLNPVAKALRVARQKLTEVGFDEKVRKMMFGSDSCPDSVCRSRSSRNEPSAEGTYWRQRPQKVRASPHNTDLVFHSLARSYTPCLSALDERGVTALRSLLVSPEPNQQ